MSSLSIDYNNLLSSALPAVPYDVTFLIFEEEKRGEVLARKFFALNRPFFESKFCGSGNFADKNDTEVDIIGTLEAFQLLTNFLYNNPTTIDELSVDEIFDVVNMAHCYHIAKMEEALEQRLGKFVIAKDDVIEAAKIAEEFARFASASQALLGNCAKSFQAALADAEAVFKFSSQEAVSLRLVAMMKNLQPLCSNCHRSSCIFGARITQVRVGTRLVTDPSIGQGRGRSEVVSVSAGTVTTCEGQGRRWNRQV